MPEALVDVAPDLWIVDGPDIVFAGASMHTRMTIVRLSDGGLWVHSPIDLQAAADVMVQLGDDVRVLIAPNKFHHLYIQDWRQAYPNAAVFAEPELQRKVAHLQDAQTLTDSPPEIYAADLDQLVFAGNRLFAEAVFFHRASRTLILTDLMINLPLDQVNFFAGLFLRFEGVVFPNGGIPRLFRWLTSDRAAARRCYEQIVAWAPQRVTLCHGGIFTEDVDDLLAREFAWLD